MTIVDCCCDLANDCTISTCLWQERPPQKNRKNTGEKNSRPFVGSAFVTAPLAAAMRLLQGHKLGDGAKVVAEMEIAGRLDAGENALFGGHS